MRNLVSFRLTFAAVAVAIVLAACGSDEPDTASPVEEPVETTVPASEPDTSEVAEPDVETEQLIEDLPSVGGSTEVLTAEEVAEDELDQMIVQLGLRDLEGISSCIVDLLEEAGLELTGQGSPELAALIACEPDVVNTLFTLDPSTDPGTSNCLVTGLGRWITDLPLTEADSFFQTAEPPSELVAWLADQCSLSEDDVVAAL